MNKKLTVKIYVILPLKDTKQREPNLKKEKLLDSILSYFKLKDQTQMW